MADYVVREEKGTRHSVVYCSCGWREMVMSEGALREAVHAHKLLVHGDSHGAANYVGERRRRGGA